MDSSKYKKIAGFPSTTMTLLEETEVRTLKSRLVGKTGTVNIAPKNISKRKRRYLADIFTTLIDIQWRYLILMFVSGFLITWLVFGAIWYLMSYVHGDFDQLDNEEWNPCIENIHDYTTVLLFSMETQTTIGYGTRFVTDSCPEGVFLVMFQSVFGALLQALLTGLIFSKVQRPKKRAQTLLFSKTACICKQDGVLWLMIRVGDMRKSHMIKGHASAVCVMDRMTSEGDYVPCYRYNLEFGVNEGNDRLFLVWPVIIKHKISPDSPFWELSPDNMRKSHFELIVVLEGVMESTSMTVQVRTSYLPEEIQWGRRFKAMTPVVTSSGDFHFNYADFNTTIPSTHTPGWSAKDLLQRRLSKPLVDPAVEDPSDNFSINSESPEPTLTVYTGQRFLRSIKDYARQLSRHRTSGNDHLPEESDSI